MSKHFIYQKYQTTMSEHSYRMSGDQEEETRNKRRNRIRLFTEEVWES